MLDCSLRVVLCSQVGSGGGRERTRLQAADEVPLDGAGKQGSFLAQFLGVILAKVRLRRGRLVEGQDVVCRLQLGDGDEADLGAACKCTAKDITAQAPAEVAGVSKLKNVHFGRRRHWQSGFLQPRAEMREPELWLGQLSFLRRRRPFPVFIYELALEAGRITGAEPCWISRGPVSR